MARKSARVAPKPLAPRGVVRGAVSSPVARAVEPSPLLINGELVLHGAVGDVGGGAEHFTARQVLEALSALGPNTDITVRLNSPGGMAFEGLSIYNSLSKHRGRVTVHVAAVAASAASLIAMSGDTIEMAPQALLMIHNASAVTFGNKAEHEKSREMLAKIDKQMAKIYAERSGLGLAEISRLMDLESWFSAEEAVELGLADKIARAATARAPKFDWSVYRNVPAALTGPRKPAANIREFEHWLRENGWSRGEAKALASGGWKALRPHTAAPDFSALIRHIKHRIGDLTCRRVS